MRAASTRLGTDSSNVTRCRFRAAVSRETKASGGNGAPNSPSGKLISFPVMTWKSARPTCCSGERYPRFINPAILWNWATSCSLGALRRPASPKTSRAVSTANSMLLRREIKRISSAASPVVDPSAKIPAVTTGCSRCRWIRAFRPQIVPPQRITTRSSPGARG